MLELIYISYLLIKKQFLKLLLNRFYYKVLYYLALLVIYLIY